MTDAKKTDVQKSRRNQASTVPIAQPLSATVIDTVATLVSAPTATDANPPPVTGELADLVAIMARLRADCPWDKKQDNLSLIPYAIEEAYELGEAVQADNDDDIKSELGDVLLQVVFHSQLYAEQGRFGMAEVIATLQDKLIRRHPHVFDKDNLPDAEAVKQRWDEIKRQENRGKPRRRLDVVTAGSALMQAQQLQKQAGKLGFDFSDVAGAMGKLHEEIAELQDALAAVSQADSNNNDSNTQTHPAPSASAAQQQIAAELGDCLFALVNVARKLDTDAEAALLSSIHKFRHRFGYIEDRLSECGKTPETSTLEEMDVLWEQAKKQQIRD